MTDYSNVRSHNVVAMESVSCYQLGRTEFTNFLKSIKATKLFFSSEAQKNDCRNSSFLSPNRRISCMNTHGQKDERRQRNILRRFAKFTSESLWNSLYHRMFREMTLRPWRSTEYGSEVHRIMQHQPLVRSEAIKRIIFTARMTFKSAAPEKRTEDDNLFMFGLLSQRNALRGGLCSHWSVPQLKNLATSMTIKFIPRFEQVLETVYTFLY